MKRETILATTIAAAFFYGCGAPPTETAAPHYRVQGDTVYIRQTERMEGRIMTETASTQLHAHTIQTAGTIRPISTRYAYIAPPFAGRVTRSFVHIGQTVSAGTPLFEMISSDYIAAQKEYFQAKSEYELAEKDFRRKEDLQRNGVASVREMEEAASLLEIAEKELENAASALRIFQVDPDRMTLGEPLIVRSPIAGQILETRIISGEYLREDAEPVAVVADLSEVWITAQVKEKDLPHIHSSDDLSILVPSYPDLTLQGKVYHIDEAVDEETRSVQVISVCKNPDEILKLGMYVSVRFTGEAEDRIVIPEKALLQDEDHAYVFVQADPGTYVKTPVTAASAADGHAVVYAGLTPGDKIITQGGYFLK